MFQRIGSRLGLVWVLCCLSTSPARADTIGWLVQSSGTASPILSDQGSVAGIHMDYPAPQPVFGRPFVVLDTLSTFIAQGATGTFTLHDRPFHLVLKLTNSALGATGSVAFSGYFSGSFSASGADLSATITGSSTASLAFGSEVFACSLQDWSGKLFYRPPGIPSQHDDGYIRAYVTIAHVFVVPEPSALLLAGAGAALLGLRSLRRR
jgi:hypothetical protein